MIAKLPKSLIENLSTKKRARITRQIYELSCMAADEEIVYTFDEIKKEITIYDITEQDQGLYTALALWKMVIREKDDMAVSAEDESLEKSRKALRVVMETGEDFEPLLKEQSAEIIGA